MNPRTVAQLVSAVAPRGSSTATELADARVDDLRAAERSAGRLAAAGAMVGVGSASGGPHDDIPSDPDGVPIWPSHLVGSITHSRGLAAAVVASSSDFAGIGLDLECRAELPTVMCMAVAASRELAAVKEFLALDSDNQAGIVVMVAKEAVYKAHFPKHRQRFEFDDITLTPTDCGIVAAGGPLLQVRVKVDVRLSAMDETTAAAAWW